MSRPFSLGPLFELLRLSLFSLFLPYLVVIIYLFSLFLSSLFYSLILNNCQKIRFVSRITNYIHFFRVKLWSDSSTDWVWCKRYPKRKKCVLDAIFKILFTSLFFVSLCFILLFWSVPPHPHISFIYLIKVRIKLV